METRQSIEKQLRGEKARKSQIKQLRVAADLDDLEVIGSTG